MRRLVLAVVAVVPLATALAAKPVVSNAGGLPACQASVDEADAYAASLEAALEEADAEIAALEKELAALRAAALPTPLQLDDVVARLPLGGGARLDPEALQAFAKAFVALGEAASRLDLLGAIVTVDPEVAALHAVAADDKGAPRVPVSLLGAFRNDGAGGTATMTAPKIDLNP